MSVPQSAGAGGSMARVTFPGLDFAPLRLDVTKRGMNDFPFLDHTTCSAYVHSLWAGATEESPSTKKTASVSTEDTFDKEYYGKETFDEHRQITYWSITKLSIHDYHYGSGDAEKLGLITWDRPRDSTRTVRLPSDAVPNLDIQEHFMKEFKHFF